MPIKPLCLNRWQNSREEPRQCAKRSRWLSLNASTQICQSNCPFLLCRVIVFTGNKSFFVIPTAESTASRVQPAKQFMSTRPSAPSDMLRDAFRSSCAGHFAIQPFPLRLAWRSETRTATGELIERSLLAAHLERLHRSPYDIA